MNGFLRYTVNKQYIRVVTDRGATLNHLFAYWGTALGADFYKWLLTESVGSTFLLTKGVRESEYWIMTDPNR